MSDRLSDKCNPHPEAPHGFDRNSSATEDRYVCDCEHWQPPDDLRTRIAAVLADEFKRQGYACEWAVLADAVIRELNLAKACDSGCVWQIPNHYEDMTLYQRELLKRTDDE